MLLANSFGLRLYNKNIFLKSFREFQTDNCQKIPQCNVPQNIQLAMVFYLLPQLEYLIDLFCSCQSVLTSSPIFSLNPSIEFFDPASIPNLKRLDSLFASVCNGS